MKSSCTRLQIGISIQGLDRLTNVIVEFVQRFSGTMATCFENSALVAYPVLVERLNLREGYNLSVTQCQSRPLTPSPAETENCEGLRNKNTVRLRNSVHVYSICEVPDAERPIQLPSVVDAKNRKTRFLH